MTRWKIFLFSLASLNYHRFPHNPKFIFLHNFSKLDLLKLYSFLSLLWLALITTASLCCSKKSFLLAFLRAYFPIASSFFSKILKKGQASVPVVITTHLNGGKLDLPSALKCMLYDIFLQILQIYNFIFTTFQKNFLYLKENFTFLIFLSGESRVLPLPCLALKFNFILKNLAWTDFSKYSNFFLKEVVFLL